MKSLKIKIVGLITLIVVVIVAVVSVMNFRLQRDLVTRIAERDAQMLTETVKRSIAVAMQQGNSSEVARVLTEIKNRDSITAVRIIDPTGRVLLSAERNEIGTLIPQSEMDSVQAGSNGIFTHAAANGLSAFTPILNSPECTRCHAPTRQILGILEVDFSLDHLGGYFSKIRSSTVNATLVIVILVVLTLTVFLIVYVDKPIRQLINAMQQVEQGDFTCQAHISSSSELEQLGQNFNRMVIRLENTLNTAITHERELARAQEKLHHHREIHTMNRRLEEQLLEIEGLNSSLVERIEEIEEANYKIADLAGELEDKNNTLENAVAKLSNLYKIGLGINSTMELDRLFSLVVTAAKEALGAEIGFIGLLDPSEGLLKIVSFDGFEPADIDHLQLPLDNAHVSCWVIRQRRPLLISDFGHSPQFPRRSHLGFDRRTLICAPLQTKDELIGTITVVNRRDGTVFKNDELELLSTIAAQASIAIRNAQLYDEQQRTYLNTIHALVSAIEASDSYTMGHSERVTQYSLGLARRLDLPPNRLKVIERAAILHDIGKIGIDPFLLHKKGGLSNSEFDNLRQHPSIGMKILEPIEFLQDVRICIGQHHERFDGRGYPYRVPADQLLVEARILSIADAFDAMTSDRPYRKALPLDAAIQELQVNAGSQFDPLMIPHFIDMIRRREISLPSPSVTRSFAITPVACS